MSTSPEFIGTELALSLQGDDLSVITAALDIPDVPGVSFNVHANVARVERGITIDAGVVKLGNDVIQVDGLIGKGSRAAIRDVQKKLGLPETGTPSPELLAKMRAVAQQKGLLRPDA